MIEYGVQDKRGRVVSLREIDENWQLVADIAPLDDQRRFVPALAARYLLLSDRGETWNSLAVYADETVTGHVMWGLDDEDGSHWIGGLLIDGSEQGAGIGRAATETLFAWLAAKPGCHLVRLSYAPDNVAAERLYLGLGFKPTDETVDGERVVERYRLLKPRG
jgi:diamine N-acetyltransferase